jgi:hypothetical protein
VAERLIKPSVATPATPTADVLPEASSRTVTPTAAVGSEPIRLPAAAARTAPLFAGTASQPTAAALIGNPAPVAASISSIGGGLNQLLTNTANWLAQLPGGPITELIQGAVYLVRRTLFPTSVGVVTRPIMVPIYPTEINGDKNTQKLGIYITLGSGATPALFELDTGGPGLYAAYASNNPNNSDWWGNGVVTTSTPVQVLYTSGNSYSGYLATSQVSIYSAGGTTPLLSTGRADVGQMNSITNGSTVLWSPDGLPPGVSTPPISEAFYGDFGLAQPYAKNGITNVLAQLIYTNGVKPGYRIHTDLAANTAWLQIGLTKADLQDPSAYYYPAVLDPLAPPKAKNPYSGLPYYSEQIFQANIKISDAANVILNSIDVGMTTDTGAQTALHNTDMAPLPFPSQYAGITDKGRLKDGLNFTVTGTTTNGTQGQVYNFTTGPGTEVKVINAALINNLYYLNTGALLFYQNDVVFGFGDRKGGGVVGLIPKGQ